MTPQNTLPQDIEAYHRQLDSEENAVCSLLAGIIARELVEAEGKLWHAHPVWFIEGNPIVGYSRQKAGIRLMFWSGADFDEEGLNVLGKKFKDASVFYQSVEQLDETDLVRWLEKSRNIQWDYKNIVKRKGQLLRLK
jgi:hypothetical protein